MGYTIDHTIVVTSQIADLLRAARDFAASTGAAVSEIVPGAINGSTSFVVAPDGSKEGWGESDIGDARREQIKTWLRSKAYDDGSTSLRWFEVEHPEDGAPRVVDHQTRKGRAAR